ncbi:MAG: GPR1/FUN34/YaaH family transporter [Thermoplasmatota archaeon]
MAKTTAKTTVTTSEALLPAEPAALGLIGLAVAAFVIGSGYLGLTSGTDKLLMIPWILFFGASAQLVAGIMEFKRNNIFGATVFTTYAMTMYAIAFTLLFTIFGGVTFDIAHYAFGLMAILMFSLIATLASLMTNKVLLSILIVVDIAVVGLIFHYLTGASSIVGGIFLLATSVLSFYAAASVLINTMAGKTIFPLGGAIWKP